MDMITKATMKMIPGWTRTTARVPYYESVRVRTYSGGSQKAIYSAGASRDSPFPVPGYDTILFTWLLLSWGDMVCSP